MLWAAILYAGVGSWITHLDWPPPAVLLFEQQTLEADFRFSLVRSARECGGNRPLSTARTTSAIRLWDRFGQVVANWFRIMRMSKRLLWFTAFL